MIKSISDAVKYIGADDNDIDLFESQYVVPNGMCYNSYVILDEKIAVLDTIDRRKTDEWFENLEKVLDGKTPDYLVVSHLEPDHAYNIQKAAEKYPTMKIIGNDKTFRMMPQFFTLDLTDRTVTVKEGDTVDLGEHKLSFYMAPMVHWPEVMVTYESTEKILFSADGFGKFGTMDADEDWACEARRYYFNICGKYGTQVQALLKKAATLDIKTICPLHGPILTGDLSKYIGLYDTWSKYEPETDGIFIAYASIHGNTKDAALKLYDILKSKTDLPIAIIDLTRNDMSEALEDAFRYSRMIMLAPTYDGGIFPCANDFLHHLKIKAYQNRKVAVVENGSWAPMAGKIMKEYFGAMKNIEISPVSVTIRSVMTDENKKQLEELADSML